MDKHKHKHSYAETRILEVVAKHAANDKLPGERVFAKELGVSYMTARKAVESLVAQGILYRIPKKGTYVADPQGVKRTTRNIGYFLDSSIKGGLSSPYYSLIFDAIEKEATRNGYALIYFSDISESNSLKRMKKIDGVIASCFPRVEDILQTIKQHVPLVCIDNCSTDNGIPSVAIDNFSAVFGAIQHLYSLGHQRIGFITGLEDSDVGNHRLAGYIRALDSCGIDFDKNLVYKGDYTFETGAKGAHYFLSLARQPTAIMCANDTMAIGAIKVISVRGVNVPYDISVIGFDDIAIASQMHPALTTVSAPVEDIAKHSVNMLISMMNGIEPGKKHITLPAHLVLRNSSAPNKILAIAEGY